MPPEPSRSTVSRHRHVCPFRFRASVIVLTLVCGGCASYRAAPLPDIADLVDSTPTLGALSARPQAQHPLVQPSPIDLHKPLSDFDVGRLALVGSPDLAALRARVGVGEAQLFAAGLLPDPQLSLARERPTTSGPLVAALGLGIASDLTALFGRSTRIAASRHGLQQIRADVAWNEWLAFNHARLLARRIPYLQRQIDIAAEAETLAKTFHDTLAAAMRSGDARIDEVALAQVGYLDARDRRLALQRQWAAACAELNALLGVPPDTRIDLAPPPAPRAVPSGSIRDLTVRAAGRRLDLLALQEGHASQEQVLRGSVRQSLPLPQLTWNRSRDTSDIWSQGPSIGLTLPLWNRGRGDIAIATATRAQLASEYAARVHQLQSDIAASIEDLRRIEEERQALLDELPELEQAASVVRDAATRDLLPLTTYEPIRAARLDKRLLSVALEQACSEADVALETLLGDTPWQTSE